MPHVPTEATKSYVKERSRVGIDQDKIAAAVGITAKTLRKYYRVELDRAEEDANVEVANTLFSIASGCNKDANIKEVVTAAIFWLKTRAGWRETEQKQHGGEVTIRLLSGDDQL